MRVNTGDRRRKRLAAAFRWAGSLGSLFSSWGLAVPRYCRNVGGGLLEEGGFGGGWAVSLSKKNLLIIKRKDPQKNRQSAPLKKRPNSKNKNVKASPHIWKARPTKKKKRNMSTTTTRNTFCRPKRNASASGVISTPGWVDYESGIPKSTYSLEGKGGKHMTKKASGLLTGRIPSNLSR